MADLGRHAEIARFAAYEYSAETGELRRQGLRVPLQEQPARVLELLLRNSGRVVTRDELREALWPADTFVDFDHGLNTAVRKLRAALDDSADTPRCIETLAKRGYRFLLPVEWSGPVSAPAHPSPSVAPPAPAPGPHPVATKPLKRIALGASAGIALVALAAWALLRPSAAEPLHRAIAVLPIENADPGTAYVSEGIAEAIIDGLSTSPALRVTARTSSFRYRSSPVDLRAVGRELGVTAIVTGRLVEQGDEYRLRLELVDTSDGAQLWAKDFRQDTGAVDTLRARAVSALSLRLGVSSADRPREVRSAEAYDLYLRGRYHWNLRKREEQLRAVEYFERAVQLDPKFAPAWAGLANVYGTLVGSTMVPGREEETQLKSIAAAKRAIELDPKNAEAYASLAASKLSYYNDYTGAERDFQRAIALNPSIPAAHLWYGNLLTKIGRMDEARRETDIGWELDPFSHSPNSAQCFCRFMARRYDEAIDVARRAELRDPEMGPTPCLAWANLLKGDVPAAVEAVARMHPERADALAKAVEARGTEGLLRLELEHLPAELEYQRAAIHAMLGERDAAFAELERSYTMHRAYTGFLWVDPRFDSIRDDPRFLDLALRLNLPQAKAAAAAGEPGRAGR